MTARARSRAETILLGLAALSVVVLFGLRIYAAIWTVSAQTPWDDRHYRQEALADAAESSFPEALGRVFLPNTRSFGIRTVGYNEVLVLGLKVARTVGLEESEIAFQLTNAGLLLVQLGALALLVLWATGSMSLALSVSFLYLSTPIMFGMNRWLLTENFVAPGLLVGTLSACWLLTRRPPRGSGASRLWAPVLAAYLTGIFATTREYAAPAMAGIALCLMVGLLLERRRAEAVIYLVVLAPFALAAAGQFFHALEAFLTKAGSNRGYFHPLKLWVSYLLFQGVGVPMAVLLGAGLVSGAYLAGRHRRSGERPRPSQIVLFGGLLALALFYAFKLSTTLIRVVRPVFMPMLLILIVLIVGARLLPSFRALARRTPASALLTLLILGSWGTLTYQLFFAFDGGRSFLFGPWGPEVENYPLGLRPLLDAEDSHTVTLRSAEARVRKRAVEAVRADIAELREDPASDARRRLLHRILDDPYVPRAALAGGDLILTNVQGGRWTHGARPAAIVAVNREARRRPADIGLAVRALPGDYPVTVFVDDGKSVRQYEFARTGTRTVRLGAVPPGSERLFLVWSSKAWRRAEGERLLGVQFVEPRERRPERAQAPKAQ